MTQSGAVKVLSVKLRFLKSPYNCDEFITYHDILTTRETVSTLGHIVSSFSRQHWRKVVAGLATGVCIMRRIGMPTYTALKSLSKYIELNFSSSPYAV